MSHQFYIQNASRRSAQAFPISLPTGSKFSDAKHDFANMLGIPIEQIIRLTTAEGAIVLPGQEIPSGALLLEVERRAFDRLTGAGSFTPLEGCFSWRTLWSTVVPTLIVFLMFAGYTIILGGIASASNICQHEDNDTIIIDSLFAWGPNVNALSNGNPKFGCGLGLSLFWWIISAELVVVIFPAVILLFWAGSFNADTKGSWAYIITCTLNILTALLCYEAFVVVPGSYYISKLDSSIVNGSTVAAVKVMAAGVITLVTANFFWIISQAYGKMIPDIFQCCMFCSSVLNPATGTSAPAPTVGVVNTHSPLSTPTKAPAAVVVSTA